MLAEMVVILSLEDQLNALDKHNYKLCCRAATMEAAKAGRGEQAVVIGVGKQLLATHPALCLRQDEWIPAQGWDDGGDGNGVGLAPASQRPTRGPAL